MYILVNPKTNVLIKIADECTPITNNNGTRVQCSDEVATGYFFESENVIYPKSLPVTTHTPDTIPEEVEVQKYLYTVEGGFVVNDKYQEPVDPTADQAVIKEQTEKNTADIVYLAMMMDVEL